MSLSDSEEKTLAELAREMLQGWPSTTKPAQPPPSPILGNVKLRKGDVYLGADGSLYIYDEEKQQSEPKVEQKTVTKPSMGLPQRVIPEKCEYARAKYIPGAPSPVGNLAPAHEDLARRAEKEIRQYVCSRFRDWPVCGPSQRNVEITLLEGFDPGRGEVLRGAFICPECSKR